MIQMHLQALVVFPRHLFRGIKQSRRELTDQKLQESLLELEHAQNVALCIGMCNI